MSSESQFKIIIAIKLVKELNNVRVPNVRCTIQIQDKSKSSSLPFNEGQFFDIKNLDVSRPILMTFALEKSNKEIGTSYVQIPEAILQKEEIELADDFAFEYEDENYMGVYRGSYYIIILNKKNFNQKEEDKKKEKADKQVKWDGAAVDNSPQKKGSKKPTMQQRLSPQDQKIKEDQQKRMQDKVEKLVKQATKELKKSKDIDDLDQSGYSNSKQDKSQVYKASASGIMDDQPARISNQVQITKSSTLAQRSDNLLDEENNYNPNPSPIRLEKMQTFNIDESPSRGKLNQSQNSSSPHKHSPGYKDAYNSNAQQYMASLYYIDQANQSEQLRTQTDYLKKVIYALQNKIDAMKGNEKNNDRLLVELQRGEQKRKQMEGLIKETKEGSKRVRLEFNGAIDGLVNEKIDLFNQLRTKGDQLAEAEQKIANMNFQLQQYQNQIQQMDRRINELTIVSRQVKQQEQKIVDYDKKILENLNNYEKKLKDLQGVIQQVEQQKDALQKELNGKDQAINQGKQKLQFQEQKNRELIHEAQSIQRRIQMYQGQEQAIKSLNDQVQMMSKDIVELNRQKQTVEKENHQLKKENGQLKNMVIDQEKQHNEKMDQQRQRILELEDETRSLSASIEDYKKQIVGLNLDIKSLQLNTCVCEDLMKQVDDEKVKVESLIKANKDSQQREKDLQNKLNSLNKDLMDTRLQLADTQQQLVDTQEYCGQLKKLILEMKEVGVAYLPVHNDPIDKALADFINSLHDPSRLINMFIRESEGVYMFGNKRVYIRLEQDRILIRTGGGFMGIEEFLDVFAPGEIDKMKDQDPKNQYEKNQAISKAIDGSTKVVSQKKNQQSPVRQKQH